MYALSSKILLYLLKLTNPAFPFYRFERGRAETHKLNPTIRMFRPCDLKMNVTG
jgi:hypothetical protein